MNELKLNVKIFADGANEKEMLRLYESNLIKGLTTNPTLMRQEEISNYEEFARKILLKVKNKPISFEVFADDFERMEEQAIKISEWQENVYVKIPITNTKGYSSCDLIKTLTNRGIKINVTALMTIDQVEEVNKSLNYKVPSYVSIFAGRIADTGIDPVNTISESLKILENNNQSEIIWASPRELLNIFQANDIGCHAITVTTSLLDKLKLINYDLKKYSLDTVKMFYDDALKSGYSI
tara:strand:+ start:1130 stop:1843 length:714 start_codon:yes stop_codon:yes gene_type:complete